MEGVFFPGCEPPGYWWEPSEGTELGSSSSTSRANTNSSDSGTRSTGNVGKDKMRHSCLRAPALKTAEPEGDGPR